MRTEAIILAQGTQERLRGMSGYKQMLALPECGGVPIMARTIQQLCRHLGAGDAITTVAWPQLGNIELVGTGGPLPEYRHVTLPEPGNSSLKGIARYLELRGEHKFESTVVLFGDVVYSWSCLHAMLEARPSWSYFGTSDLSASGGELWGVVWGAKEENHMRGSLRDALLRHPPFEDDYQPGQMRRWLMGWKRGAIEEQREHMTRYGHYCPIDDYTQDIDLPVHVAMLPAISRAANKDDVAHGMHWVQNPDESLSSGTS
jgi:hypothetical protein